MLKIIVNTTNVDRKIAQARRMTKDLSQPMNEAGKFFTGLVEQSFEDQRDPYGVSWKALKDSTLRARRKRGNFSTTILVDTGKMLSSLKFKAGAKTLSVSMNKPAEFHQEGTGRVPMRRIFPISFGQRYLPKAWSEGIIKIFSDFTKSMFK